MPWVLCFNFAPFAANFHFHFVRPLASVRRGICNFIAYLKTLAVEGPEPPLSPGEIRLLTFTFEVSGVSARRRDYFGPWWQRTDVSGGGSTFASGGL